MRRTLERSEERGPLLGCGSTADDRRSLRSSTHKFNNTSCAKPCQNCFDDQNAQFAEFVTQEIQEPLPLIASGNHVASSVLGSFLHVSPETNQVVNLVPNVFLNGKSKLSFWLGPKHSFIVKDEPCLRLAGSSTDLCPTALSLASTCWP